MASLKRVARYEYDPYGNTIVLNNDTCDPDGTNCTSNSGYANANTFRFSTKWLDWEVAGPSVKGAVGPDGLYYYGYRYYSPRLGRWLSDDPIWELGWFESIAYHHLDMLLRSRLNADPGTVERLMNLRRLLDEFKKPGPLEHKYGLSLYICANNNLINVTDPLGGCEDQPKPQPRPTPTPTPTPSPGEGPVDDDIKPYCERPRKPVTCVPPQVPCKCKCSSEWRCEEDCKQWCDEICP